MSDPLEDETPIPIDDETLRSKLKKDLFMNLKRPYPNNISLLIDKVDGTANFPTVQLKQGLNDVLVGNYENVVTFSDAFDKVVDFFKNDPTVNYKTMIEHIKSVRDKINAYAKECKELATKIHNLEEQTKNNTVGNTKTKEELQADLDALKYQHEDELRLVKKDIDDAINEVKLVLKIMAQTSVMTKKVAVHGLAKRKVRIDRAERIVEKLKEMEAIVPKPLPVS